MSTHSPAAQLARVRVQHAAWRVERTDTGYTARQDRQVIAARTLPDLELALNAAANKPRTTTTTGGNRS